MPTLVFIQEHLAEPLTIERLARHAGFSSSHFRLLFQGLVGESVYQHIRRLRLERAGAWLLLCDDSLDIIARRVGFESREAFTRAFTAAFTQSPTAFRAGLAKRKAAACDLPAPSGVHDLGAAHAGREITFRPLVNRAGELTVRTELLPPVTLACTRHVGNYEQAQRAWLRLIPWAARRKLLAVQPIYYGINYDDEQITDGEQQRYDAGIVVPEPFTGDGAVFPLTLPGGLCAICPFSGSFAEFATTWNTFLYQWLPGSEYELRECFGFDRYHPPQNLLRNPIGAVWRFLRRVDADLCIPIQPRESPTSRHRQ